MAVSPTIAPHRRTTGPLGVPAIAPEQSAPRVPEHPAATSRPESLAGTSTDAIGCPAGARTLVDVLRHRATHQPSRWAYTFLADGEEREVTVTYAELDRKARAVAASIAGSATPGDRALLMYPAGLEFVTAFMGCLYAGVVPVPLNPPRSNRHIGRVRAVIADASTTLALTDRATRTKVEQALACDTPGSEPTACVVVETDAVDLAAADRWREVAIAPHAPAFLQYTSGSTGTPKGVMVTHANIMANEAAISGAVRLEAGDVGAGWLPMYHDMGLIGAVLNPLYGGYPMVLMAPTHFLQEPMRWLRAISRYRCTMSAAPNFAFELCLKAVKPTDLAELDLSSWRIALNGAEPVRAETLTRFTDAFRPCGFAPETHFPSYGLAEGTLLVTAGRPDAAPVVMDVDVDALGSGRAVAPAGPRSRRLVGCGTPAGSRVVIVQPETRRARACGEVGEIWVSGASVAAGYWNRPEESAQTFGARLSDTGEGPFLRTGDLGFVNADGEVFVTGRCKDVVVIRGRNIYPQDIEAAIERTAPFVRPNTCAVFGVEVDGEETIGALIEADRALAHRLMAEQQSGVEDLVASIRQAVSEEFDVMLHTIGFVKPGSFPRTSSGKVQRSACKQELGESRENTLYVSKRVSRPTPVARREQAAPLAYDRRQGGMRADAKSLATETADRVKRVIAEVCGIAVATVRDEAFLIAYDIDSLRTVELLLALEEAFGIEASENDPRLQEVRSVRDLAAFVAQLRQDRSGVAA
jgi:acyl carrier protein